jgi:hypothetical protein
VICRWGTTCAKCETAIAVGDQIKPQYRRQGMREDGRPNWVRVPKAYVHAPKCPKVTPNRPGQRHVDPTTGEITEVSPIPRHTDRMPTLWDV